MGRDVLVPDGFGATSPGSLQTTLAISSESKSKLYTFLTGLQFLYKT